ncbi:MAG: hypothetical protein ACRDP1_00450 [Nocardioidaceae bacterium]
MAKDKPGREARKPKKSKKAATVAPTPVIKMPPQQAGGTAAK